MIISRLAVGVLVGVLGLGGLSLPAAGALPFRPPDRPLSSFGIDPAGWTPNLGGTDSGTMMHLSTDGRNTFVASETHRTAEGTGLVEEDWYSSTTSGLRAHFESPDLELSCTPRPSVTKFCEVSATGGSNGFLTHRPVVYGFLESTPPYTPGDPVRQVSMTAIRGNTTIGIGLYTRNDTMPVDMPTLRAAMIDWINQQWDWTPPVPTPSSGIPSESQLRNKVSYKVVDISRRQNVAYRNLKVPAAKLKLPKAKYRVWGKGFNTGKRVKTVYLKASFIKDGRVVQTVCMKSRASRVGDPFSPTSCKIKRLKRIQ